MRGTLLRASLALGICLLAAPSAGATPPGLHVDPNSPGGKEYAIPLDQARDQATGGGSQSSGGGSGSHLFGVGVGGSGGGGSGSAGTASSGGGGGSTSGGSSSGGSHGSGGSGHSRASGSTGAGSGGSHNRLSPLNVAAANPESGAQAPLLVLGGSAGIVFAGVLLGLMFRRRRMSGSPSA